MKLNFDISYVLSFSNLTFQVNVWVSIGACYVKVEDNGELLNF